MSDTTQVIVQAPDGGPRRPVSVRGLWRGAAMIALGALGTWLTWRFFVATAMGQRLDEASYSGARIGRRTLWQAAEPVLQIVSVPLLLAVLAAAAVVAVVRRRWVLLVQVGALVGGANLTTQLLKNTILDRPELVETIGWRANSLPSGHTTVAATVAVALVLLVPPAWRPVAALLGGAYAATTGVATMVGGWHRPSDVIAALTVVLAWSGVAAVLGDLAPVTTRAEVSGLHTGHRDLSARGSRDEGVAASPARVVTTVVEGLLSVGAVACGLIGVGSLITTHERLGQVVELSARSELATAYVGSALGVVGVTSLVFALVLAALGRAPDRPINPQPSRPIGAPHAA